jgi:hypothetical protein
MKFTLVAMLGAALLTAGGVNAQAPERVRGAIASVSGDTFSVKSGKGSVDIALAEKTEIVYVQPIAIGDIKAGDFLGVTSQKAADGSLTAFEIRRFPKPLNPGHRPFDGRDDQTMTNATVSTMVQSANGRELTLSYEGGSQKVVISDKASISMLVPGQRSQLVPGAPVNLTARPGADGKLTALRIQVGAPSGK